MSIRRQLLATLILLALAIPALAEDWVMFDYQGLVRVHGQAFDGTGQFKFAIINSSGSVTLWSNDGSSVGGGEPTASVSVVVNDGIYHVRIGDPSLGMVAINRSIFNNDNVIKLRVWFSDGSHGFQSLDPDRRIINPQLLGVRSGETDFTIYVNSSTGNDENSGLSSSVPKKTIQSAVNMLPPQLRCNVTIDIANGVYREQVAVSGVAVQPGKALTFLGDEAWTPSSTGDPLVRVTGNDNETTGTKVRNHCFALQNSTNIVLKGLLIDNAKDAGVWGSWGLYRIWNCKAANNKFGFFISYSSFVEFRYCVADHNTNDGIDIWRNCTAEMLWCKSTYNPGYGVSLGDQCMGYFYATGDYSNNGTGIQATDFCKTQFVTGYSGIPDFTGTITGNSLYGLRLRFNSYSRNYTQCTISGNGTNLSYTEGSALY